MITIYKSVKDTKISYHVPIEEALERIRNSRYKDLIEQIRNEPEKDKRDKLKIKLPAFVFSGKFSIRSTENLIEHSGYICIDFDKLPDVKSFKEKIIKDKYVFSCFISPSGRGIKVIVKIPANKDTHGRSFDALAEHFASEYFDLTTRDIPRACFESYDPDIYINHFAETFEKLSNDDDNEIGTITPDIPVTSSSKIIEILYKWWNNKYPFVDGQRNSNLYILSRAFNTFGVDKIEAENFLRQFISNDFSESEINQLIKSAYKNTSEFRTKFFEDTDVKDRIQKKIKSGETQKEIQQDFPDINIEQVFKKINEDLNITDFWTYDKKGGIKISHHKFKHFLQQNNFFKYYPQQGQSHVFVKIEQNLVSDVSSVQIKDFVLDYLMKRTDINYSPFDYMANCTKLFKDDYLSMLDNIDVYLKEDTIEDCFLYFKNCALRITKNEIEKIPYVDLDGYVWKNQIIQRDFIEKDFDSCDFQRFVYYISGENEERFASLISIIGYLLHSFKTSANNKAIILNDETISENPNGGSGKGLFWNGLSKMKKLSSIDGKQFDFNKSFAYQTVSPDTQVLVFDDVKKNFNFENLFSIITEGITIEKKNKDAIKIPVNKSPKILITTNYTIQGIGGSFDRRKFEVELSAYFGVNRTPLDVFGHLLFDEWTQDEWTKFDNFMIYCCQYYLQQGLIPYTFQNLETRKFINQTAFEFYEWTNDGNVKSEERLTKTELYNEFLSEYKDFAKWLSQKKFSAWLKLYADFKNLDLEQGNTMGHRWVLFKDKNND